MHVTETGFMKYARWILAVVLAVPASAFAFYKPIRVLLPEAFGVSCERNVCVDDRARLDAALALLDHARRYLETEQGLSVGDPKIVFCSHETCRRNFGVSQRAGFTLGTFGIVIAPRGWQEHYVAHELIHYWQAENFGSLALLSGEPWLIEGMAYALSNDPRRELQEPFESYRQRFNDWRRRNAGAPLRRSVGEAL
jgi:hypothetical protein